LRKFRETSFDKDQGRCPYLVLTYKVDLAAFAPARNCAEELSPPMKQSRRHFLASASLTAAAGVRLHEAGMLRTSPNALLAEGTDWRFVEELKRELKV
jgi:NitT/TauT family transport system substrate-binding protein